MERIYYAGSSFLTGDAIAQALVNYARFLVAHRSTAAVDIPIRNSDGSKGRASFLLGPTTQLVSKSEWSSETEIEDATLVSRLRDQSSGLTLSNPGSVDQQSRDAEEAEVGRYFDLYDLREYM